MIRFASDRICMLYCSKRREGAQPVTVTQNNRGDNNVLSTSSQAFNKIARWENANLQRLTNQFAKTTRNKRQNCIGSRVQ
jgi:hypothetical protein